MIARRWGRRKSQEVAGGAGRRPTASAMVRVLLTPSPDGVRKILATTLGPLHALDGAESGKFTLQSRARATRLATVVSRSCEFLFKQSRILFERVQ